MADERSGFEGYKQEGGAVERLLKALGQAQTPEGLEARVAARLERQAAMAPVEEFQWSDVLRGSAIAGAWWRGVMAGAVVALLVAGVAMTLGHWNTGRKVNGTSEAEVVKSAPAEVQNMATAHEPCASVTMMRAAETRPAERHGGMRIEVADRLPRVTMMTHELTPQERALVLLAQNTNPKEMASLSPEVREKRRAEEEAQYESFFAKPAPLPAVAPTVIGGPGLAVRGAEGGPAESNAADAVQGSGGTR